MLKEEMIAKYVTSRSHQYSLRPEKRKQEIEEEKKRRETEEEEKRVGHVMLSQHANYFNMAGNARELANQMLRSGPANHSYNAKDEPQNISPLFDYSNCEQERLAHDPTRETPRVGLGVQTHNSRSFFTPISGTASVLPPTLKNLRVEPVKLNIDAVNVGFQEDLKKKNMQNLFNLDHANDKFFALEHQAHPQLKKVDELGRVRELNPAVMGSGGIDGDEARALLQGDYIPEDESFTKKHGLSHGHGGGGASMLWKQKPHYIPEPEGHGGMLDVNIEREMIEGHGSNEFLPEWKKEEMRKVKEDREREWQKTSQMVTIDFKPHVESDSIRQVGMKAKKNLVAPTLGSPRNMNSARGGAAGGMTPADAFDTGIPGVTGYSYNSPLSSPGYGNSGGYSSSVRVPEISIGKNARNIMGVPSSLLNQMASQSPDVEASVAWTEASAQSQYMNVNLHINGSYAGTVRHKKGKKINEI